MKNLTELVLCGRSVYSLLLCGSLRLVWLGGQNKLSEMETAVYCLESRKEKERRKRMSSHSLRHLTALSIGCLRKAILPQLVEKFPTSYGIPLLITALTTARHLSVYEVRSVHLCPPLLLL